MSYVQVFMLNTYCADVVVRLQNGTRKETGQKAMILAHIMVYCSSNTRNDVLFFWIIPLNVKIIPRLQTTIHRFLYLSISVSFPRFSTPHSAAGYILLNTLKQFN